MENSETWQNFSKTCGVPSFRICAKKYQIKGETRCRKVTALIVQEKEFQLKIKIKLKLKSAAIFQNHCSLGWKIKIEYSKYKAYSFTNSLKWQELFNLI